MPQATAGEDAPFYPNTLPGTASHSLGENFQSDNAFAPQYPYAVGSAGTYMGGNFQISAPCSPMSYWGPQSSREYTGFQGGSTIPFTNEGYGAVFPPGSMTNPWTSTSVGANPMLDQGSSTHSSLSRGNSSGQNITDWSSPPSSHYLSSQELETTSNIPSPLDPGCQGSFPAFQDNSNRLNEQRKTKGRGADNVPIVQRQAPKNTSQTSNMCETKQLSNDVLNACNSWIHKNPGTFPRDSIIDDLSNTYNAHFDLIRKYFDTILLRTAPRRHAPLNSDHDLVSYYRQNQHNYKPKPGWLIRLRRDPNRPFVCTRGCGCNFAEKTRWTRHEETHWTQKIWKCRFPDCQPRRPSERKDHMQKHLKSAHKIEDVTKKQLDDCLIHITNHFPELCIFHDCSTRFVSWKDRVKHVSSHLKSEWNASQWRSIEDDTVNRSVTEDITEEADENMGDEESNSSHTENGSAADHGSDNSSNDGSNNPDDNAGATGPSNGDDGGDDACMDQNPDSQTYHEFRNTFDPTGGSSTGSHNYSWRQTLSLVPDRNSASNLVLAQNDLPLLSKHLTDAERGQSKEEMRCFKLEKYLTSTTSYQPHGFDVPSGPYDPKVATGLIPSSNRSSIRVSLLQRYLAPYDCLEWLLVTGQSYRPKRSGVLEQLFEKCDSIALSGFNSELLLDTILVKDPFLDIASLIPELHRLEYYRTVQMLLETDHSYRPIGSTPLGQVFENLDRLTVSGVYTKLSFDTTLLMDPFFDLASLMPDIPFLQKDLAIYDHLHLLVAGQSYQPKRNGVPEQLFEDFNRSEVSGVYSKLSFDTRLFMDPFFDLAFPTLMTQTWLGRSLWMLFERTSCNLSDDLLSKLIAHIMHICALKRSYSTTNDDISASRTRYSNLIYPDLNYGILAYILEVQSRRTRSLQIGSKSVCSHEPDCNMDTKSRDLTLRHFGDECPSEELLSRFFTCTRLHVDLSTQNFPWRNGSRTWSDTWNQREVDGVRVV